MNPALKTTRLQAIYSKLPAINCKRLCQDCCGPIPLFPSEAKILLPVTRSDHVIQDEFPILLNPETGSCPHLSAGACSVRSDRPLICRLWGLVEATRCPHGCIPDRWVSEEDAHRLMFKVEHLPR